MLTKKRGQMNSLPSCVEALSARGVQAINDSLRPA